MNEIPAWEQFIRFVLQGLSNGTAMQIHEFEEHLTSNPTASNEVITNDVRNFPAWAFLIFMWQLAQLMFKYGVGVETKKPKKSFASTRTIPHEQNQ